jgi:hypothetical protein
MKILVTAALLSTLLPAMARAQRLATAGRSRSLQTAPALGVAPDEALWTIEDANPGGLFRVTPK